MAAPATTTRTAVANTQLSAGKRILVLRAFRRMWKPLVDASQLDRQGRWMSTTQGGKPCFMFSQGDAAPAFFDHAADYKDALTPVLAGKLIKLGMAYTPTRPPRSCWSRRRSRRRTLTPRSRAARRPHSGGPDS